MSSLQLLAAFVILFTSTSMFDTASSIKVDTFIDHVMEFTNCVSTLAGRRHDTSEATTMTPMAHTYINTSFSDVAYYMITNKFRQRIRISVTGRSFIIPLAWPPGVIPKHHNHIAHIEIMMTRLYFFQFVYILTLSQMTYSEFSSRKFSNILIQVQFICIMDGYWYCKYHIAINLQTFFTAKCNKSAVEVYYHE